MTDPKGDNDGRQVDAHGFPRSRDREKVSQNMTEARARQRRTLSRESNDLYSATASTMLALILPCQE